MTMARWSVTGGRIWRGRGGCRPFVEPWHAMSVSWTTKLGLVMVLCHILGI